MQTKVIKLLIISIIIFIIGVFFMGLNKSSIYDTKSLEGQKITNIKLEHFSKKILLTEEYLKKKNFTLINFWASWCAPCRLEHPFLLKLNSETKLNILGVNFKDKKNNAINFLNSYGNPYDELVRDDLGKKSVNFGVYGIPESILVNKDLIIIKKFIGPLSNEDYKIIQKIFK